MSFLFLTFVFHYYETILAYKNIENSIMNKHIPTIHMCNPITHYKDQLKPIGSFHTVP